MTTNTTASGEAADNAKPTKRPRAHLHRGGGYVGSSQTQADRIFARGLMAAARKLAKQQAKAKAQQA